MNKSVFFVLLLVPLYAEEVSSSDVLGLINSCQDVSFKGTATFLIKQAVSQNLKNCTQGPEEPQPELVTINTAELSKETVNPIGNSWYVAHASYLNRQSYQRTLTLSGLGGTAIFGLTTLALFFQLQALRSQMEKRAQWAQVYEASK